MKLLFDQNISFRILHHLPDEFSDCKQVRELGLENYKDIEIWEFAKRNAYTIVTFDADFCDIASIKGSPPKIIWLRTGNMTTENIAGLLLFHQLVIKDFTENTDYQELACLEIA